MLFQIAGKGPLEKQKYIAKWTPVCSMILLFRKISILQIELGCKWPFQYSLLSTIQVLQFINVHLEKKLFHYIQLDSSKC